MKSDSKTLEIVLEIESKMQETIRKYYKRHWRMIFIQIDAINEIENPKRGFLFDCCAVDHETIHKMLSDLRNCNAISSNISVVDLNSDTFIVNRDKFKNRCHKILIDISENLSDPKLLTNSTETIHEELLEIEKRITSHQSESILKINSSQFQSPPTLYGFLINYPILYFLNQSSDENCLSHKNLKVFQVSISNQILLSFSVPESLFNQCDDIKKSINNFLDFYNKKEHCDVTTSIANYPRVIL